MGRYSNLELTDLVKLCISRGHEGDFWDFKQEWHKDMPALIKDIICFVNTVHSENCYLIFGISDDCRVVGMKQSRYELANIIDALSKLEFATIDVPEITLDTIVLDSIEVDVLTILNTDNTPIYLRKPYGKMRPGCIYTPDNSNALFGDIEMLWKKRFRLTKPPLEYIKNHLNNPLEWNETQDCYYNIFRPEYVLEHVYDESDRDLRAEFYAYAMTNEHVVYSSIVVKCSGTIVDNYQIVALDGGRYTTPTPEWGFLGKRLTENGPEFSYKYFLKDSFRYSLHSFMYHEENGEERYAHDDLMDIVLLFDSVDEKNEFERYVEYHIQNLRDRVDAQNEYSYVRADSEAETRFIIHRLRIARVLQSILKEYREWVKKVKIIKGGDSRMAQRTVALCNGKYIGIETIYTVINGWQINIP